MVFLTCTKGLGINDDLMFFIDRGNAIVPLNSPFVGGHLGAFIIGDITFDLTHMDVENAGFAGA